MNLKGYINYKDNEKLEAILNKEGYSIEFDKEIESSKIFFDKKDAEWEHRRAQDSDDDDGPTLRELTMEQFVAEARDAGCDDWGISEMLLNEVDGFDELMRKVAAYDVMIESRRKGAEKANAISAEQRKARAKKAAQARWSK